MTILLLLIGWCLPIYAEGFKSQPELHYVTTKTYGQLGNQMFNIATALSYAWDNDLIASFPFLNEGNLGQTYNRDHLFFRILADPIPKDLTSYGHYKPPYAPIPIMQDVMLDGYFFSWRYFHHHREKILKLYAPSKQIEDYLEAKYSDVIRLPNTVAVHVRTYSKHVHGWLCPFVGLSYFKEAFKQFPKDCVFVVFSDRINWCRFNFTIHFPELNFIYIDGNDHIQDLILMSKMKHFILSNSTYSWWGAYLNENSDARVYYPMHMVRPWHPWNNDDYYLPSWKMIPYNNLNDPYPEDMTWYDHMGKSLEER